MGTEEAIAHLRRWGRERDVLEFDVSSATVELAARALGVEPGRIAKTLSFGRGGVTHLILFAGDARVDNAKYKARFGMKASMLSQQEVLDLTGHPVGGVCPFGLKHAMEVWLDESLRRFDHVFPACGSGNSAIRCTLDELELWSEARGWVDVSRIVVQLFGIAI
jgi:prolyl-tRNA editing enzyme YbaK/EbsC (Cys-tRNA(Pro) deacylase)